MHQIHVFFESDIAVNGICLDCIYECRYPGIMCADIIGSYCKIVSVGTTTWHNDLYV